MSKKGRNTENTTFLHVKMTVVQGCARAEIFKIVFYGQNDAKTVKKKRVHPCARKFENQLEYATSNNEMDLKMARLAITKWMDCHCEPVDG